MKITHISLCVCGYIKKHRKNIERKSIVFLHHFPHPHESLLQVRELQPSKIEYSEMPNTTILAEKTRPRTV